MDSIKLPDFIYVPDFITQREEDKLIKSINTMEWQNIEMYGKIAKRRVVHLGLNYSYNHRNVAPTQPAPRFLRSLINKCANLLNINPKELAEILLTEYSIGAGIGWHRDAKVFDKIIGISLANATFIQFRKRGEKEIIRVQLEPRSAYVLTGEIRWEWDHAISPVKSPRYSITLRTLLLD